jgi:hypothetical protein
MLRALVWLGGTHWDLKAGAKLDIQYEAVDDIQLVRQVRANQKAIARL